MVKKKKNSKRKFNIDGTIYLLPSGKGLFKPDDVSEDEIIKGEGTGYVTAKEIENEISELTEDGSPYWNKTHPNHQKTVDQVFKLREQLNG